MHGAQSVKIERRALLFEDLDEARHVRAFDVMGKPDVHGELGDGVLHVACSGTYRDRIAQSFHPHALDRQLARIGQRLRVRQRQILGGVHRQPFAGEGLSASSFSSCATNSRSSGSTLLAKVPAGLPLRSIRYLWKFHLGWSPVRATSSA